MTKPFVEITQVSKTFTTDKGTVNALAPVSFEIPEHRFLSILGPSGCGKSTLLSLIAGLVHPTTGVVKIRGSEVRGPFTDIGIVFQRDVLLDWRTVLNNVLLQAEIRKLDLAEAKKRARQLLAEVGLEKFEDAYPFELSGGMRQRAAICRAFLHDPPLLLMDEPFAALDSLTRDQMSLDLQAMWETRQKTVLFITHSVAEAVFLSDTVLIMTARPGQIHASVAVNLPRPRTLAMRESIEFLRYTSEITDILKAVGILRERSP
jgi:NitT/TauT family transport system ATP-binding protein